MACGVTTTLGAATATCDNTGTSSHAGNHSGLINVAITVFGFTWDTTTRIYWRTGVTAPCKQKAAVVGTSDWAL